jgi:hypothetical protein
MRIAGLDQPGPAGRKKKGGGTTPSPRCWRRRELGSKSAGPRGLRSLVPRPELVRRKPSWQFPAAPPSSVRAVRRAGRSPPWQRLRSAHASVRNRPSPTAWRRDRARWIRLTSIRRAVRCGLTRDSEDPDLELDLPADGIILPARAAREALRLTRGVGMIGLVADSRVVQMDGDRRSCSRS